MLEPVSVSHAEEAAALFDDVRLHEFTGGKPLTLAQLRGRYARLAAGDPSEREGWLNWTVRLRANNAMVGTAQATLCVSDGGSVSRLAWTTALIHQRCGYATEATGAMVAWLGEQGIRRFLAHIHPAHVASMAVARHIGLAPTGTTSAGEVLWAAGER
jgi:RimJ/RimL family protein N-acetyltransferase